MAVATAAAMERANNGDVTLEVLELILGFNLSLRFCWKTYDGVSPGHRCNARL